jgi:anti-anti-sigma factor
MTEDLHPVLRKDEPGSARRGPADVDQNVVADAVHTLDLGGNSAGLAEAWADAWTGPAVAAPGLAAGRSGARFRFSSDEPRPTVWLSGEHDVSTDLLVACTLGQAISLTDSDVVVDLSEVRFLGASTISVVLAARRVLAGLSRNLSLRAPSMRARRIIDICGLSELVQSE